MEKPDQLPEFVCTRKVRAGKIARIEPPEVQGARIWHLYLEGEAPGSFILQPVDRAYIGQHGPLPGGWFVQHEDGQTGYYARGQFEADFARAPAFVPVALGQVADDAYMRWPLPLACEVVA